MQPTDAEDTRESLKVMLFARYRTVQSQFISYPARILPWPKIDRTTHYRHSLPVPGSVQYFSPPSPSTNVDLVFLSRLRT